jgi:hypothetical protein
VDRTIIGTLTDRQEAGLIVRKGLNTVPVLNPVWTDEEILLHLLMHLLDQFADIGDENKLAFIDKTFRAADDDGKQHIFHEAQHVAEGTA